MGLLIKLEFLLVKSNFFNFKCEPMGNFTLGRPQFCIGI